MNINKLFIEGAQIVPAIMPIDLNAGANNGDWVSMKDFNRCTVLVLASAGTAANDLTMTVRQATDVSGTDAKALNFTRIDSKQGTLSSIGQFTEVTQSAANTYTDGTNGEDQLLYAVDFQGADLDVDNGFDCVQVQLNQVGAAKVGTALYILSEPKFSPPTSAIAD